jgi:DNA gyrase subunit A
VRTPASEVSVLGRNTQGVRLIRLDEGERLIGVESVDPEPVAAVEGEGGDEEQPATDAAEGDAPAPTP